jgi:hypothetical protein
LLNNNYPSANTPYFQNKDQSLEVQDSVTVFPSATLARKSQAAIANAKTPGCMAAYFNGPGKALFTGAKKNESVGSFRVVPINAKRFGRGFAGFVIVVPVTYQGVTVKTQEMIVSATKGRVNQVLNYNSYGVSFPTSLAKHLDSVALARL